MNIFTIIFISIISLSLRIVPQTIFYHIAFISLRSFAGGYHAKTHTSCFIISTATWLLSMWGVAEVKSATILIGFACCNTVFIWIWAPVDHIDNPIYPDKYKRLKKTSRIMSLFLTLLIAFMVFDIGEFHLFIPKSMALGMATHTFLLAVALLQKHLCKLKLY